jgi:hypothetical protein
MSQSTRQGVLFEDVFGKSTHVVFDGEASSSDGGAVLLAAMDRRGGVTQSLASAIVDARQAGKVRHTTLELLRQRVFGVALGMADCNDAERSAADPVVKALCGRAPIGGADLASQPTLSRFENAPTARELVAMQRSFERSRLEVLCRRHRGARRVVIDLDSTDDPTYGDQQYALFSGFYGTWCYLPLVAFVGFEGDPDQYAVSARLRPGTARNWRTAAPLLRRIVAQLRRELRGVRILVRLDAGFASPMLFDVLEALRVEYVVGIQSNAVLDREAEPWLVRSRMRVIATAASTQHYGDFRYAAKAWEHDRRVVVKAEVVIEGGKSPRDNPRYVVTNLRLAPEDVFVVYRGRGDSENRLKELLLDLEMDRTSCSRFLPNQIRVLFAVAAYALYQDLRWSLRRTDAARLSVASMRLRLVKIGARVVESARRIVLHLPAAHPWKDLFRRAALAVGAAPA